MEFAFPHARGKRMPIDGVAAQARCYIDLKIGGTIFSAAWICFNDFGFLPWVPEAPKASDLSPIPPACLLAAIRRAPVNYRDGQ
jgi:hypothetical protein